MTTEYFPSGGGVARANITISIATKALTLFASNSGSTITNLGATAAGTVTLPAAGVNMSFTFVIENDQSLTINCAGTDKLAALGSTSAAGISASTSGQRLGSQATIRSNPGGTGWIANLTPALSASAAGGLTLFPWSLK